jgi:hypothetical protein
MHCCHLSARVPSDIAPARRKIRSDMTPHLRAVCRRARAAACRPASSSSRHASGRPSRSRGSSRTAPGRWATGRAGPATGHSSAALPCSSPRRGRQICWRRWDKRASKAVSSWAAAAQALRRRIRGRNGSRRVSWPHVQVQAMFYLLPSTSWSCAAAALRSTALIAAGVSALRLASTLTPLVPKRARHPEVAFSVPCRHRLSATAEAYLHFNNTFTVVARLPCLLT